MFRLPALVLLLALAAPAATIYVDDNAPDDPGPGDPGVSDPLEDGSAAHPFDAIQEGINAASPDSEVVVATGTYTGPGNRDLDYAGKAITVRGSDPDDRDVVAATIIDCQGTHALPRRGFNFHSDEGPDSVVAGLTIINGHINSWDGGGAISCYEGEDPTIRKCRLINNHCDSWGGAICCGYMCTPSITDCLITGNSADRGGGGISASTPDGMEIGNCIISNNIGAGIDVTQGSMTITGCEIGGNSDSGLYSLSCILTVTDCDISNNQAYGGAGVYFGAIGISVTSTMTNCRIYDNVAENFGGGMNVEGLLELTNCRLSGNEASYGGAIYCLDEGLKLYNCLITGNRALTGYGAGGAIDCDWYQYGGSPTLINCSVTGNSANHGGAINANSFRSSPTLINSILWGNSAPSGPEINMIGGATLTLRYSTLEGGVAAAHLEDGSTIDWGTGCSEQDPVFYDPAGSDNDPLTWQDNNYRLAQNSPCIDAGDNDAVPIDITTDLDGIARFLDEPSTPDTGNGAPPVVDLGAYEFVLIPGDYDHDRDVDSDDWAGFESCASGPAISYVGDCQQADFDGDGDVDPSDFGVFQRCFSGENSPGEPTCND